MKIVKVPGVRIRNEHIMKPLKSIDYIIIHASLTPPEQDIGAREMHYRACRIGGFGIGYHYVIRRNGTVERGRKPSVPGLYSRGYNHISLGICLIGGCNSDGSLEYNFTGAQQVALEALIDELPAAIRFSTLHSSKGSSPDTHRSD